MKGGDAGTLNEVTLKLLMDHHNTVETFDVIGMCDPFADTRVGINKGVDYVKHFIFEYEIYPQHTVKAVLTATKEKTNI
jgi:hypothetical protein